MSDTISMKDASRKNWAIVKDRLDDLSTLEIQLGAILRIADATEAMAKRHVELIDENKGLRMSRDRYLEKWREEEKKNRYLRAQITRLKNKMKAAATQSPLAG